MASDSVVGLGTMLVGVELTVLGHVVATHALVPFAAEPAGNTLVLAGVLFCLAGAMRVRNA
ncbi:uncharacterized protein HHUB_3719 [Halobacterium hubeiense]|uniref:Uncharacterized protein n=2 Tax=Halobacterium TaxID=2239 RepID=A0A0U5AJ18_9EURY|nr:hypothetical protein [Halobacterium hubeiense]CQH62336.1 uncharacterized protein HHUB_3719 [Halobacterium hubeiense]